MGVISLDISTQVEALRKATLNVLSLSNLKRMMIRVPSTEEKFKQQVEQYDGVYVIFRRHRNTVPSPWKLVHVGCGLEARDRLVLHLYRERSGSTHHQEYLVQSDTDHYYGVVIIKMAQPEVREAVERYLMMEYPEDIDNTRIR